MESFSISAACYSNPDREKNTFEGQLVSLYQFDYGLESTVSFRNKQDCSMVIYNRNPKSNSLFLKFDIYMYFFVYHKGSELTPV